jgi:hypothetical protein
LTIAWYQGPYTKSGNESHFDLDVSKR